MSKHRVKQKLMAIMLSAIMVMGITPDSASAEASKLPVGARGEIIAFDTLGWDIAVQSVPLGTSQVSLGLPDFLTATVQLEGLEEAVLLDLGELLWDADMVSKSTNDVDETDAAKSSVDASFPDKTETDGSVKDEITILNDEEETLDSTEEITVSLPVTWSSTPEYNSEAAGIYLFTPKFSEGIALARGVEVPTISVTVGASARVTFDPLPDDIRWQNTTAPTFPKALGGIAEGENVPISVTWEADHHYDAEYPAKGLYVFTAVLEEGYKVADGMELPRITVYIPQSAGRMMARMAGGGTTNSPLEITTPAQLSEIAQLVNAGKLETFLFNDSTATTYLELKNHLNLSAYGASFNDSKGWAPIGTAENPFKGNFDGGGNRIVGLYINNASLSSVGLFGSVEGGMVQNLILSDVNVRGSSETGGIAGRIQHATVKNCGILGSVMGSTNIGGVAGGVFVNGTVEHCYSVGNVISSNNHAGGIVGNLYSDTSTVRNCYSTAMVEGKGYVGGIAGFVTKGTDTIQDCAALNPSIRANTDKGRVAGQNVVNTLLGNVAFRGMTGGTFLSDPLGIDGEDITAAQIKGDGTMGNRFTAANGWTVANGSLPSFGGVVDIPSYIADHSDPNFPGAGTSENPYQISTAAQLAKLSELVRSYEEDIYNAYSSKHYKLTADIDLSVYNADNISFNGGKGWIPIGGYFPTTLRTFSGIFDGDGHTIKGLYLNDASYYCGGLFGSISNGTVKNLGIVDAYIHAGYNVGGISAMMIGTVENSFVTGNISGVNSVGGMIGDLNSPSSAIINCYSTASVRGVDQVGGFVGRSNMGCVINSYVTGTIYGAKKVGGVVGDFYGISGSKVQNCVALNPSITGNSEVSRVIGSRGGTGVISGNHAYADMTVTMGGVVQTITDGTADNINGLAKTADELQGLSSFPSVFGSAPWTYTVKMLPGLWGKAMDMPLHLLAAHFFDGGDGSSAASAYEISNASQLAKLAELVSSDDVSIRDAYKSKHYKLMNDIDLSAYGKNYDGGKGWVPIGRVVNSESRAFNGKFDGNGKIITGLFMNRPEESRAGLFGNLYESEVKNLAVVGANMNGKSSVGGIAGMMSYGTIQGCYISGTISGERFVGGIVGAHAANNPILKNCRSDASVSGKTDTIGGIVAWTVGTVENCYTTGAVSGGTKVGGIAGDVSYNGNVRNCVALNPSIIATSEGAGRVAGNTLGLTPLTNNYAFSGMKVNGNIITGSGNNSNGTDLSIAQANASSFWITSGNWNASLWTIADHTLPILTVFPVGIQSPDRGVYLTERDMANATVGSIEDTTYNGILQIPTLTVTFDGTALVQNTDYTISITSIDDTDTSAGTNVGEVTLTITGKGNFKGKTHVTYTIHPKTLTTDMLTITGDSFVYTSIPHTPDVIVTDNTTLASSTDYDVAYSHNTNAGEATVSVTGKGNYMGTVSKSFTIQKAPAPTITWPTATHIAYGSALLASALVGGSSEYGDFTWKTPETIPTVTNSGYEVIFTPNAATVNNYEPILPTTETVLITVTPKNILELTIDAITPMPYTGVAQTPAVTIQYGSTTLAAGVDYEATYSDNTSVGTATMVIEGKGNYIGSKSHSFTITKRPITVKADNKSMNKGAKLPTFTYTVDGQLPTETALVGTPTLTCSADGKVIGNYPILVDLTGVSYTANYEAATPMLINGTLTVKIPSSGGSGGGSSSGSDKATIASEKEPRQPVTSETSVTATADKNGVAHANISDTAIAAAITKAQEAAKNQGKTANGIGIDLHVNMPKGTSSLRLTLSQNALKGIVGAGVTNLAINGGMASLVLDLEALQEIQTQCEDSITITIKPMQNLSESGKKLIGTRTVYDVTISYSKDGKMIAITSLGKGKASLSLPYTPGRNESVCYLFGVYVDDKGNATRIPGSAYDSNSGSILLDTNHLSIYGVGYQSPSEKYTDITTHWAKESIDYGVGRGLFSGTTDITFSPDMAMSRGMLITVLGKLSNADVSTYKTSSFTDVAIGKYYLPYIEWAYKKGIISIGNGKFAPERAATREEIALFLQNYAKATDYKLPVAHEARTYGDASSIGSVYKTAVTTLQQAGIMMGDTNNTFHPKASATRAEVSSMLHRYIKLTIDPTTAQGWVLNDAGQYLYYKEGKALMGTQTIDGAKYFFNTHGTLKIGWVKDGDNWYFYDGNKLLIGWQNIHGKWYYFYADGFLAKNTTIDGYEVGDTGARKN